MNELATKELYILSIYHLLALHNDRIPLCSNWLLEGHHFLVFP